jgi:hypothetical protein
MARYKHIDTCPRILIVDLQRQLLPGIFEYAVNHLLDHELDLTGFVARFSERPYCTGLARRLASTQADCILEPLWCHYGWGMPCLLT